MMSLFRDYFHFAGQNPCFRFLILYNYCMVLRLCVANKIAETYLHVVIGLSAAGRNEQL